MKYIVYDKISKKVVQMLDKAPITVSENLAVALCNDIPNGDIFTVTNIVEQTKTEIKENATTNDDGEAIVTPIEVISKYFTCTISGFFDDNKKKRNEIKKLKEQIAKYKEDVEQVELFGMDRADYAEKKELCKNIVLRLRELENELKK